MPECPNVSIIHIAQMKNQYIWSKSIDKFYSWVTSTLSAETIAEEKSAILTEIIELYLFINHDSVCQIVTIFPF